MVYAYERETKLYSEGINLIEKLKLLNTHISSMPKKRKSYHAIKTIAELKRSQSKARKEFIAHQKHQLVMLIKTRKKEAIFHKTGKWPAD